MEHQAEVKKLLRITSDLELRLVNLILDAHLNDVYADELLSTMSSLKQVLGQMLEAGDEVFWENARMALGKINRIEATFRVLTATKKIGQRSAKEIVLELLNLEKELQVLTKGK
ncbi:MAG: hypothetical protein P8N19_10110 [Flavobacteriales bacterium]|nr:hypothetical protein [Flavobacteriales bacterium]MDG1767721.1 hypothetical protein [Flavobacteriales bacterium]